MSAPNASPPAANPPAANRAAPDPLGLLAPGAPRFKICGLTSLADVQLAADAGAWALGFVLAPASPRCVAVEAVSQWRRAVQAAPGARALVWVAVFLDPTQRDWQRAAACGTFDAVQLHRSAESAVAWPASGHSWARIEPVAVESPADVAAALAAPGPYALIDRRRAADASVRGAVDWSAVRQVASQRRGVILAGGLTPENVGEALRQTGADAVDVASGVERRPGVKDPERVRAFAAAVRGPERARGR